MTSKGYHYVINFGIVSNFYISILARRPIAVGKSFKEKPPFQLFPGVLPWRGINTANSVIRGSRRKGHKPPFWISVQKGGLCQSPREKKLEPNKLFLIWFIWSWLIWVSVKILIETLWMKEKKYCKGMNFAWKKNSY